MESESGLPVFSSHTFIEVAGRRIGIFGVLLSSLNRTFQRRVLAEKYRLLDAVQTTRDLVPRLREQCDVLIALSHVNVADNEEIARTVPGIDAIIDPFSQRGNKAIWVAGAEYIVTGFGAPILRIDGQGSRVGVFEMRVRSGLRPISEFKGYDAPIHPHIYSHPELVDYVNESVLGTRKRIPVDFDPTQVRLLPDSFIGYEGCGACHEEQQAFWERTAHSTAYSTLEKESKHLDPSCIDCHTLAYGLTFVDPTRAAPYKNVQCESCHWVKPLHAENPSAHRFGRVREDRCWACHNESITEKPFDYAKALEQVACPRMENRR
ncbi:MAG: hypothetical protein JXA90_15915 [Planctomycetes bacterium]|nr:hypothetical protein [Planctomycetota bacterium]